MRGSVGPDPVEVRFVLVLDISVRVRAGPHGIRDGGRLLADLQGLRRPGGRGRIPFARKAFRLRAGAERVAGGVRRRHRGTRAQVRLAGFQRGLAQQDLGLVGLFLVELESVIIGHEPGMRDRPDRFRWSTNYAESFAPAIPAIKASSCKRWISRGQPGWWHRSWVA